MKEMNFAVIGFGSIARTHALAICDANLRFSLPYRLNLKYIVSRKLLDNPVPGAINTDDINRVLQDDSIRIVDICTPNELHGEAVRKAAAYGKAVYCEKPLSSELQEAEDLSKLVRREGTPNAVALIYRFMPAIGLLRRALDNQSIGDIIDFKIRTYHSSYLSPGKAGTWRTLRQSGGGALLDLGIHLVDLVRYTLGEIEEMVNQARIYFCDRSEVDEISRCEVLLKGGIRGSLEVSRVFAEREQTDDYIIFGTKGSIKLRFDRPYEIETFDYHTGSSCVTGVSANDPLLVYYAKPRNSLGYFQDCHTASLISFCNGLAGNAAGYANESAGADFEDAYMAQRIIRQAYEQGKATE